MPATVLNLDEHRPHSAGEAICLECRHMWAAVTPIGSYQFDCPKCGSGMGRWRFPFGPEVGVKLWTCRCGNDHFVMTPEKIMCAKCGQRQIGMW